MRKLFAATASLSLAAAPASAQPPQETDAQQNEDEADGRNMKGELWGYLALPAIIVVILLIAVLRGEDEGAISP
jgi:hypothetical protein